MHNDDNPNKCDQCDYVSSEIGMLMKYMIKHCGKMQCMCTQCEYVCSAQSALGFLGREKADLTLTTIIEVYRCPWHPGTLYFGTANTTTSDFMSQIRGHPQTCCRKSDLPRVTAALMPCSNWLTASRRSRSSRPYILSLAVKLQLDGIAAVYLLRMAHD